MPALSVHARTESCRFRHPAVGSADLCRRGFEAYRLIQAAHAKVRLEWAAAVLRSVSVVALVLAPSYLAGRVLNYGDIRAALCAPEIRA
jgi:hypothetical protein